jgi:NAD(P)-dependent dehydrogenase (short-subunit alcohol dehydrogenase family)
MDKEAYPLADKVILITGATKGIGEAVARKLYALGGRLVMHGRNPVRLEAVMTRIQKAAPDSPGSLDFLCADFSVMQQVYDIAEAFKQRYKRLHILINNAGAIFFRRQVTADGLEKTFAVNHLAHFLLTRQLLELLKASAPSKIITVSSAAHFNARLDFNNLQLKKDIDLLPHTAM